MNEGYFFLAGGILVNAFCQVLLKTYHSKKVFIFLPVSIFLFCMIPVMSFFALKTLSLSVVYISTCVTHILVILLAKSILSESITQKQLYGISMIVLGIATFALG